MKKRKKEGSLIKKIFILIVSICFLIIFFVQFFLGGIIKNIINDKSGEFLNAKVNVNEIGIGLTEGALHLKDLKISNPPAFEETFTYNLDYTLFDISLLDLLKKTLTIEAITIENSNLHIERNKEGKLNLLSLVKEDESSATAPKEEIKERPEEEIEETKETEKVTEPINLPNLLLESMSITSVVDFIDYKTKKEPFNIAFNTIIQATNIKTFGSPADTGLIEIEGNLQGSDMAFKTNISAIVSPLTDLTKPSFSSKATIQSIDMETLSSYQGKTGIKKGIISITSSIVCLDGQLDKEKSIQKISIKDLLLTDKMKDKLKGQTPPTEISFEFHVFGSIDNIQTDFLNAFINAVLNPKNILGKKVSDKIAKKLSKNKDAQKILATSGFGAALGIPATTENSETQESTTTEEVAEETPNTFATTEETPVHKKEEVIAETTTSTPQNQADKTKAEIDAKVDKKVKKLKDFKKKLF